MDENGRLELMSAAQAAVLTGISEETIARAARLGNLPAIRVGRTWAIRRADLDVWAEQSYQPTKARPYRRRKRGARRE